MILLANQKLVDQFEVNQKVNSLWVYQVQTC